MSVRANHRHGVNLQIELLGACKREHSLARVTDFAHDRLFLFWPLAHLSWDA